MCGVPDMKNINGVGVQEHASYNGGVYVQIETPEDQKSSGYGEHYAWSYLTFEQAVELRAALDHVIAENQKFAVSSKKETDERLNYLYDELAKKEDHLIRARENKRKALAELEQLRELHTESVVTADLGSLVKG